MYEKYIRKVMGCTKPQAKIIAKACKEQIDIDDQFPDTFASYKKLVYTLKRSRDEEIQDIIEERRRIRWQKSAGILKVEPS